MKKNIFITSHITVIDIHAKRLADSVRDTLRFTPFTSEKLSGLSLSEAGILEMVYSRFGKIQDKIGSTIFPFILSKTSELSYLTIIDKLNQLEKLGFLTSTNWWLTLREARNNIVHDYEEDPEALAADTNDIIEKAQELLIFWEELKRKIAPLLD